MEKMVTYKLTTDRQFIAKVVALRKQGMSQEAIGVELGVGQSTISTILKQEGLGGYIYMPSKLVPKKFKAGKLHSGSKTGPVVTNPQQMKAILMSEKRKETKGEKP